MQSNEYSAICDKILTGTMTYVDTSKIKRYNIDKSVVSSDDAIYTSAVCSPAPITLVYTPAGTGKTMLSEDRARALIRSGVPAENIMLLNMNIAKSKQMSAELPGVQIMTFNDFTHGLFSANFPQCKLSDVNSIANSIELQPASALHSDFVHKLRISNPQDRATLLTLFVNMHLDFVTQTLCSIQKADYALESMVCQNQIYQMRVNPYNIDALIINGVHNMPIPVLCTIIEYVNRYHCNLFMTGSPTETIYEFNMAYGNAMNILSSYSDKNIDIIRLLQPKKMSRDILNTVNMMPTPSLSTVSCDSFTVNDNSDIDGIMRSAVNIPYVKTAIKSHRPILVLARSKSDINSIKQALTDSYPGLKITDITAPAVPSSCYGKLAVKFKDKLSSCYPNGITTVKFFYELYNIIKNEENTTENENIRTQYHTGADSLMQFMTDNLTKFSGPDYVHTVYNIIQILIDIESGITQMYMDDIRNHAVTDISDADIVLTTIHAAIDIRMDHALIIMHNFNERIDANLYRVALSRANKSEHVVFINHGLFEVAYQQFIKARQNLR